MTAQTFTTGQILTAAEMNALSTQAAGALQSANNLSDVASAASTRGNLGIANFATATLGAGLVLNSGTLSASGGSGTVTSVALAAPGDFTVSGSPVTNAGTITLAHANQSANTVQAGPSSGAAAAPFYRALIAADVPPTGESTDFQAGRFYSANMIAATAGSGAPATGSLVAGTPIYVPNAISLQTLSVETTGTITGTAHLRVALYTDAGGAPGSPVAGADSGDMTQTAAGIQTSGTLNVALAPGWYWPVFETSTLAGATMQYGSQARANTQGGWSSVTKAFSGQNSAFLMTHTYGAALTTWATASEASGAAGIPTVIFGF